MNHLRNSLTLRKIILFHIDNLLILASCFLAINIKFNGIPVKWLTLMQEGFCLAIFCQIIFFISDLYDTEGQLGFGEIIWRIILAFCVSTGILTIYYLIFPTSEFSKGLLLYSISISLVLICFWRIIFGWIVVNVCPHKNIVIMGTGHLARLIAEELINRPYSQYCLLGIINPDPNVNFKGQKILGLDVWENDDLDLINQDSINEKKINKVVVAISQRRECFPVESLLSYKLRGIDVIDSPTFYERITGKILIQDLRPSWLIFSSGFRQKRIYYAAKQVFDVIISLSGLVISLPVMALVAAAIKIDSRGPVFFTQERAGKNGVSFNLYKFRSMSVNAEEESGPVWAMQNDTRVTRVGKVIRKLRLDELPQMINVLKGEMSFVGPRPERPFFIEKLQKVIPYYNQRLMVKPGITGWAAVKYQYSSSVESSLEKLQYDLYYIKNWSLALDLQVILKTVHVMITGKGSQ